LFRAAIRNAATRDPYERRLIAFLNTIGMDPDSFVDLARKKPRVADKEVISYIIEQVQRAEKGQITESTIRNPLKAIKLLLEMNDVALNWKKIRRLLPPARGYALDRIPTIDEIREILDAADSRGKALTLFQRMHKVILAGENTSGCAVTYSRTLILGFPVNFCTSDVNRS
jgi:hypothetical protein